MKMCTLASLFLGYQALITVMLGGQELVQDHPTLCQVIPVKTFIKN